MELNPKEIADHEDWGLALSNAGYKLLVVNFSACWCGPCAMINPKFDELAEEYKDTVVFAKVDVDNNTDTASRCGVTETYPTF